MGFTPTNSRSHFVDDIRIFEYPNKIRCLLMFFDVSCWCLLMFVDVYWFLMFVKPPQCSHRWRIVLGFESGFGGWPWVPVDLLEVLPVNTPGAEASVGKKDRKTWKKQTVVFIDKIWSWASRMEVQACELKSTFRVLLWTLGGLTIWNNLNLMFYHQNLIHSNQVRGLSWGWGFACLGCVRIGLDCIQL